MREMQMFTFKKLKYFARLLPLSVVALFPGSNQAHATCAICSVYQAALEQQIQIHENWMTSEWWGQYLEPGFKKLTDEVRNALLLQTATLGAYLDGQNFSSAQRTLQELNADTMKNYTVSSSVCEFGTLSRSLAASQSKAKANQLALSERSQNRQLGQVHMAAAAGSQADRSARLKQFREDYCNPTDFGTGMKALCESTPTDARQNVDINYTRAIDAKKSLKVDFTDSTVTDDEKDVIALANNLYANEVFDRINSETLADDSNTDARSSYMDQRAIVAKRSVAENSFNALVGEKSAGAAQSKTYMQTVLKNLGLSDADALKYLGDNPSYDVQMEVLTKKLYQDPAFYASLMESPANVNRQYAALQSFGLMQKRDIFETVTRSELLLSMILEMEISKYQDSLQNQQN